jgi:hypothetical protein
MSIKHCYVFGCRYNNRRAYLKRFLKDVVLTKAIERYINYSLLQVEEAWMQKPREEISSSPSGKIKM